ncbi:MAG: AraC family transcriptional regulator [Paenibacillaceae bacterium]|jgi:AraC-like DNA-binding protein|nr:AraC family transcriptional regulator [Paenibacillaceae bacterium]
MGAIREHLQHDHMFPFILRYQFHGIAGLKSKFHWHDWYEVLFVHEGCGTFFIDPSFYEMKQGDVFLLPGGIIHQTIPDRLQSYTVSVIQFDPELINPNSYGDQFGYLEAFRQHSPTKLNLTETQQIGINVVLEQMFQEMKTRERGYRHSIILLFQKILIDINRIGGVREVHPAASRSEAWMKEIFVYIENHLMEELSLTHLAAQALVSPAHFSRVFKQMTGLHVPAYLRTKRLMLVKDLLSQTDMPINRIAERCGFASPSHFHKIFKEQMGCTPAAYRKSNEVTG